MKRFSSYIFKIAPAGVEYHKDFVAVSFVVSSFLVGAYFLGGY